MATCSTMQTNSAGMLGTVAQSTILRAHKSSTRPGTATAASSDIGDIGNPDPIELLIQEVGRDRQVVLAVSGVDESALPGRA